MTRAIYDYTFIQPTNNKPLPKDWEMKKLKDILKKYTDISIHMESKDIKKMGSHFCSTY
jgi:hypothetical protein